MQLNLAEICHTQTPPGQTVGIIYSKPLPPCHNTPLTLTGRPLVGLARKFNYPGAHILNEKPQIFVRRTLHFNWNVLFARRCCATAKRSRRDERDSRRRRRRPDKRYMPTAAEAFVAICFHHSNRRRRRRPRSAILCGVCVTLWWVVAVLRL